MKSRLSKGLRSSRRNRNRKARRRNLRVEALEDRRLLTFGDPGADVVIDTPTLNDGGQDELPYVVGELIVGFESNTTQQERESIVASQHATVVESFPRLDAILVSSLALSANVPGQAEQWAAMDGVLYAEPNYRVQLQRTPNDTRYDELSGMNNIGQTGGSIDADIDAPEAWDLFTGTSDVVVAVLDTGIEYTHEDLSANMWRNPGEIPGNNIDDDGNGYIDDVFGVDTFDRDTDPIDESGHGTHVAGTIGATGNNGMGVAGVNWDVELMAVRMGDDAGLTTAAIVQGLEYVTMMKTEFDVNVVVSNASYGGYFQSNLERDAIQRQTDAGIVFVAAAGNDTTNVDILPFYPAAYDIDGIISVASTDHNDQLSDFSNFGEDNVDLAAPGGLGSGDAEDILSTYVGNTYQFLAGTSMAAPHVAGAIALLRGYEPSLSPLEAKAIVMETVDPIAALDGQVLTGGRLNVYEALLGVSGFEVRGGVWSDEDSDGRRDAGESGLSDWTVYVDLNENGRLDVGEPSTVTDNAGNYVLQTSRGAGTYTIAQVIQPRWQPTSPSSGTRTVTATGRSDVIRNVNFGNRAERGRVTGIKWHDLDGDGERDANEPGMGGIYIYADLDNSGSIALGEPAAITNDNGRFVIENVPPGDVIIREVLTAGWTISFPEEGYHTVNVKPGETTSLIGFGNVASLPDFGDAPAPYPTRLADGGASHELLPGFHLGQLVDGEEDGIPHPDALGDDLDNLNDEDGVEIDDVLFSGTTGTARVTVATGIHSAGALQGWIDFNADGEWSADEQVVKDLVLPTGVHDVTFDIPVDIVPGNTFSRWRYGYERGIGPGGPATAGEVEDHKVQVLRNEPVAFDDTFTIDQDSEDNPLDVLDNDFASATGELWIIDDIEMISDPERATVTVSADHQRLFITPAAGVFSPPDIIFNYTVSDQSGGGGKTDTATVTVTVESTMNVPVAIDDTVYLADNAFAFPIDVMANDLPGALGIMELDSVGEAEHGIVTINDNGTPGDRTDDFVTYTPDGTFDTVDQFQYTLENANGSGPESTGVVTIFNEDVTDQEIQIGMDIVDMAGDPIFEIGVGQKFQLIVTIQDTRETVPNDEWGVFSAYLDVLYDRKLVSTIRDSGNSLGFDIAFSGLYANFRRSDADLPGVLDETGAFQAFIDPETGLPIEGGLGPDKLEFFRVTFTADDVGTVDFLGNPADAPENNVLFFDPDDALVPTDNIFFGFTSLDIVTAEQAEGSPLDVNLDGYVSPWDALLIINSLNSDGMQSLAEGEPSGGRLNHRLDVNRDFIVSPYDALLVINHLNTMGAGEGEAEGEAGSARPTLAPRTVQPSSSESLLANSDEEPVAVAGLNQMPSTDSGSRVVAAAAQVDQAVAVFDQDLTPATDWRLSVGQADDVPATDPPSDLDDGAWDALLDDVAADVFEAWLDGEEQ